MGVVFVTGSVALGGWLVALCAFDIRQRRLPNALTLPGAAVVLSAAGVAGCGLVALGGAAALSGLYLAMHLMSPRGMGAGDVKLALGLGALTGCFGVGVWFLAAVAAPLFTLAVGIAARVTMGSRAVPHGPSMCVASALAVLLAAG